MVFSTCFSYTFFQYVNRTGEFFLLFPLSKTTQEAQHLRNKVKVEHTHSKLADRVGSSNFASFSMLQEKHRNWRACELAQRVMVLVTNADEIRVLSWNSHGRRKELVPTGCSLTFIHMCSCVHSSVYTHTCIYTCMPVHAQTHMHTRIHTCVPVCTQNWIYNRSSPVNLNL